jgi:DNA-binding transcriptional ArsR family regulator
MVEYTTTSAIPANLDLVFHSLSDPIRRDILQSVSLGEHSVGELVSHYDLSFAAISKHLKVLEEACLITKRKEGQKKMITLAPETLKSADEYLDQYRKRWQSRHDKLAALVEKGTRYE